MNMANELDLRRKQEISGQQTLQTLADRLTLADHLVYKKYLTELRSYGLMPLSQEKLVAQDPMECIRMYQLKELTVKKGEDMFQKLSTVYYSSMALGCSLAVMVNVQDKNRGADIYIGVREDSAKRIRATRTWIPPAKRSGVCCALTSQAHRSRKFPARVNRGCRARRNSCWMMRSACIRGQSPLCPV